jgi:hypothetical protein
LVGNLLQITQAQEVVNSDASEVVELDQAQLDQMLAPIALYPDTLLSHILVASTYPLEVIQAARWRAANKDLDEQQALDAVENKDWDPSVQALVPFNDLLQTLSEDLDWLQALGSAFLFNEEQLLASVQNLRQKAYQQGNLTNNDYVNIEQENNEIVIETVHREVIYVPYYDTRVVYGDWWWHNYQPLFWHRPRHYVFNSGFYWSIGFNIRPSFYFGGFHWRNRHVVANYNYRSHANRRWSNDRQVVRVTEYPRWSHNQHHRRGVQYRVNGQNIVRRINAGNNHIKGNKHTQQIDKQRVLNVSDYARKDHKRNAAQVKHNLTQRSTSVRQTQTNKSSNRVDNKQRVIEQNQSPNQHLQSLNNDYQSNKTAKFDSEQRNSGKSQKHSSQRAQNNKVKRFSVNTQNNTKTYKSNNKSSHKSNSHRTNSNKQNKSRPIKIDRQSKSKNKQR